MFFLLVPFFVIIYWVPFCCCQSSVVTCAGQTWEVNNNDTVEAGKVFQKWIFAWQNTCDKGLSRYPAPKNGMGSSINYALKHFITAIETNSTYRPDEHHVFNQPGIWMWADPNKNNCSLHIRSVDCYMKPLSSCVFNESAVAPLKDQLMKDLAFSRNPIDTCNMGRLAKKSLQWVLAQFIEYFFRYKENTQEVIDSRIQASLGYSSSIVELQKRDPNVTTIGVTIRAGKPDGGRKVLNVSDYVVHIDKMAAVLSAQNKPVSVVYLCSHVQEENIVSSEHMNTVYPRPYKFVVLPHASLGPGEAEHAMMNKSLIKPPHFVIASEFYADLEILASADYFIGSASNLYPLIVGLRIARGRQIYNNMSCILHFELGADGEFPLYCENSPHIRNVWAGYFGGLNTKKDESNFYIPPTDVVVV